MKPHPTKITRRMRRIAKELRHEHGLSYGQIGARFDISESAAHELVNGRHRAHGFNFRRRQKQVARHQNARRHERINRISWNEVIRDTESVDHEDVEVYATMRTAS